MTTPDPTAVKMAVAEGLYGAITYLHSRSIVYQDDPSKARQQSSIDGAAATRIQEIMKAELARDVSQ